MSLSAAIIVNDDADGLGACLTSLRGLVDEVVVVDTGSAEASAAVAEQHGAVVVHEPWAGDFAASRNRSLDLATGDWVLCIDPDETMDGDFEAVRSSLAVADRCIGFELRCVPRPGWTPIHEHRLWRNRPDIRFVGRVHETVEPAIRAAAGTDRLRVERLDRVTIHRHRSIEDRPGQRAREEPLLVAELTRHPDRADVCDHLARVYEAAGDGERAIETRMAGITRVRERDRPLPDDRVLYVELIHHLLENGVIDDQLETLVAEAREQFTPTPALELAAARLAFATGRPRDALEPLDWLVGLDESAVVATGISCDERVFGEWAWSLLGLCRFELDDDAAAADAFRRAEALAPDDPSHAVRRRLAEARSARPAS